MNDNYGFDILKQGNQYATNLMSPSPELPVQQNYGFDVMQSPNSTAVLSNPVQQPVDVDAMTRWLGGKDAQGNMVNGILPVGMQAATGLMQGWMGMQQLDLAQESFNFQKQAYHENMANQKKTTNAQLEDRQNARNAQAGGQTMSTDEYMKKYGL